MKFLCIACDEAMKLKKTENGDDALSVFYFCPSCGYEMAMLTNSMETQMVRAMDVKIGAADHSTTPMAKIRQTLSTGKESLANEASKPLNTGINSTAGKCPFPGIVEEMEKQNTAAIPWTDEAVSRLERVPDFVKPMIKKSIEQHAYDKGYTQIDARVMDEVKGNIGM